MNEVIREQPDKIAAKMANMTKEIFELQRQIRDNEQVIQAYR